MQAGANIIEHNMHGVDSACVDEHLASFDPIDLFGCFLLDAQFYPILGCQLTGEQATTKHK